MIVRKIIYKIVSLCTAMVKNAESRGYKQHEIINAISGSISGAIAAVILAPLDVVKTRLIVQRTYKNDTSSTQPKYRGVWRTMSQMYRAEGIKSLYRGLGAQMLGYIPNWAVYFTTYEYSKTFLAAQVDYLDRNRTLNHVISSVFSGGVTAVVTSPIWVVKTRMQTHVGKTPRYTSSFHAIRSIYHEEGIQAFYRGLAPSLVGLIHVGIQFPLYEYLKKQLTRHEQSLQSNGKLDKELQDHVHASLSSVIIASTLSKLVASVIAYPHEVLRSRFQDHTASMHLQSKQDVPYKSMSDAIKRVYTEEGFTAFYSGMGTNLLRVVPAAIITLTVYEMSAKYLTQLVYSTDYNETKHENNCYITKAGSTTNNSTTVAMSKRLNESDEQVRTVNQHK
jgi:solute carrier family 25 folate transporter 32